MQLKVTTPRKLVIDREIDSITVPTASGEVTILPKHAHLLSLLQEGIMTIRSKDAEEYMAIGGGYLETNGREISILVSRAYNQSEIDEEMTKKAIGEAETILERTQDKAERSEALSSLRRSLVDQKLLRKTRNRKV